MKGLQNKSRIISVIITMLVILMLIISEPAGAVTVNVDTTNMPTTVGQDGYFFFNVTIGGNEKIPVANFTIEGLPHIEGSDDGNLSFTISEIGTTLNNVTQKGNYGIALVEMHGLRGDDRNSKGYSESYGYKPFDGYGFGYEFSGYGYGYGITRTPGQAVVDDDAYTQLSYKITIDTTDAKPDTYDEIKGIIYTDDSDKESFSTTSTSSFTLKKAEESKKSSSSGGSSKYSWVSSTHTPTSTESEDTTTGQPTPTKTVGEVSTEDVQATQTPTPTETEDGGIPGFTSIMFIAGLLAAAYIIMRKKG
jgi:hypothetical protein